MTIQARWTTELLAQMPHVEGERYEIIDGELLGTRRRPGTSTPRCSPGAG